MVATGSPDLDGNLKWVRSQLAQINLYPFPQNLIVVNSHPYLGSALPHPILM
jgi:hypothetical protein